MCGGVNDSTPQKRERRQEGALWLNSTWPRNVYCPILMLIIYHGHLPCAATGEQTSREWSSIFLSECVCQHWTARDCSFPERNAEEPICWVLPFPPKSSVASMRLLHDVRVTCAVCCIASRSTCEAAGGESSPEAPPGSTEDDGTLWRSKLPRKPQSCHRLLLILKISLQSSVMTSSQVSVLSLFRYWKVETWAPWNIQ